jgi:hypothetical protein
LDFGEFRKTEKSKQKEVMVIILENSEKQKNSKYIKKLTYKEIWSAVNEEGQWQQVDVQHIFNIIHDLVL